MSFSDEHGIPDAPPSDVATPAESESNNPTLSLSDAQAEPFLGSELGDTVTATVTLKLTSKADDKIGKNVSFEVVSIEPQGAAAPASAPGAKPAGAPPVSGASGVDEGTDFAPEPEETPEEKEAGDAETKALGYKRPKVKKPAPKISAKDLAD